MYRAPRAPVDDIVHVPRDRPPPLEESSPHRLFGLKGEPLQRVPITLRLNAFQDQFGSLGKESGDRGPRLEGSRLETPMETSGQVERGFRGRHAPEDGTCRPAVKTVVLLRLATVPNGCTVRTRGGAGIDRG